MAHAIGTYNNEYRRLLNESMRTEQIMAFCKMEGGLVLISTRSRLSPRDVNGQLDGQTESLQIDRRCIQTSGKLTADNDAVDEVVGG